MKPTSHDSLDDLIAAALHGDLTPAERAQFDARLAGDPAARAAYQEAQLMHDLLEKTHTNAQPDAGFEQRMVSGVRRKITEAQRPPESAWQSVVAVWKGLRWLMRPRRLIEVAVVLGIFAILAGVALGPITHSLKTAQASKAMMEAREQQLAAAQAVADASAIDAANAQHQINAKTMVPQEEADTIASPAATPPPADAGFESRTSDAPVAATTPPAATATPKAAPALAAAGAMPAPDQNTVNPTMIDRKMAMYTGGAAAASAVTNGILPQSQLRAATGDDVSGLPRDKEKDIDALEKAQDLSAAQISQSQAKMQLNNLSGQLPSSSPAATATTNTAPAAIDTRKLIRNAELDLEVKSFQDTMDKITALTKSAGGYVDSDNSQRGGNGKLQGTVVVKVSPPQLDDFLLKLRELGQLKNQTISTEDVTKDYVDTQARLDNSRRMEAQLQDLLKRDYGKISDLLQVERELGRVRGEIEQMQGQLKLYDFQVAYATVTMRVKEKDLNQAAAYLLKEQDNFSLVSTDVEAAYQQARQAADTFKGQVLNANLNHNSGSDVSATLDVMVPPDQIDPFLAQVRTLGRVDNFTRQTQRVANDGGDSDDPADETLTQKDKVEVQIAITADSTTHKQVALTVVATAVDDALDQAKNAALAQAGTSILSSSLNKTQDGQSTAQLSVCVPGKSYHALLAAFKALGRTASFSLQRDDNAGPGASGDDEPVTLNLSLTDDDDPMQQTQLAVLGTDVDSQAQQLKQDAASTGAEIKASSFQHAPDGTETAQMSFRVTMGRYPAFLEVLKKLGKVESLSVNRNDRPDEARTDDDAPAQIDLTLHNQGDIVAEDNGLWATLRETFSDGAMALFGSVRVIGVAAAFLFPWLIALVIVAWMGRRVYVWYRA